MTSLSRRGYIHIKGALRRVSRPWLTSFIYSSVYYFSAHFGCLPRLVTVSRRARFSTELGYGLPSQWNRYHSAVHLLDLRLTEAGEVLA
jgi:hypothetical protein